MPHITETLDGAFEPRVAFEQPVIGEVPMRLLHILAVVGVLVLAACETPNPSEQQVPTTGNPVDDALIAVALSGDDASADQQIAVAIAQTADPQWKVSTSTCKLVDALGTRAATFRESTARLFVRLLSALPCGESFTLLARCEKGQWRANTGITRAGAFALLIPLGTAQNRTSEVAAIVTDAVSDPNDFVRATAYRYALHHAATNPQQASLIDAIERDPSPHVNQIAAAVATGGAP